MKSPRKILAIQFKSLGDAIVVVPSLEAIRKHFPDCELHMLVPESSAPLFRHHPGLAKVWALPRVRGRARIKETWPILRAVRAERFDRSVDFCGNDRGAIMSLMSGARMRLGVIQGGGFFGRRFCYTQTIPAASQDLHEALRLADILSVWDIPTPALKLSLFTDPSLQAFARRLLPERSVICHTGAAQSKKEWPITHWVTFHRLASAAGYNPVFSRGIGKREEAAMEQLKTLAPEAKILSPLKLAEFIAVLKEAHAVVSNDTGPMHFAAALGVPMVALFGPTSVTKWAPLSEQVRILQAENCTCQRTVHDCESPVHCMTRIAPEAVFQNLVDVLRT
ncbi:MAG TPA: glycosyltransferase family 9 protein [Verrucomicrobiae bacterium]|jgi:lipopolysaccharide heptosyltransferase II|nr:glycosyltransferase family 9 protein [Verrucomicrobiae bacterium]